MQEKRKLKAYIVSYELTNDRRTKSVAIIAYSKKEASDLFIKSMKARNIFNNVVAVVLQRTKMTNANKAWFTKAYYDRQCKHVEAQYKEYLARVKVLGTDA